MTDQDDAYLGWRASREACGVCGTIYLDSSGKCTNGCDDNVPGLTFVGGPLDGVEIDGFFARVIMDAEPPYACMNVEGRYEHYNADTPTQFRHVGACHLLAVGGWHPKDCGHDHTVDW